jgi:hypothetical protein
MGWIREKQNSWPPRVSQMEGSGAEKVSQSGPRRSKEAGSRGFGVSFVLTVWLESQEVEADPVWSWRVTHVQTGKLAYTRRLDDVLAFINSQSGLAAPK